MTNTTREIVRLYDELIKRASFKLGRKIKCDWGEWQPTEKGINRLISRRNKLMKGA
tara:strand:+ start:1187 stop:1354 length:168 start_codon:yes stop_codon:yes gene_type:complete